MGKGLTRYILILLLLPGCGEFHTNRFFQADGALSPEEAGPTCKEKIDLELDLSELVIPRGEPVSLVLEESRGLADLWEVSSGALPPGLVLDPLSGTLQGLIRASGEWRLGLRLSAAAKEGVCFTPLQQELNIIVSDQCVIDGDCEALVPPAQVSSGLVCDQGACLLEGTCSQDPRNRGLFLLEGAIPAEGLSGVVADHSRVFDPKKKGTFQRRVLITGDQGQDNISLYYVLPDNWSLPLALGDEVTLASRETPQARYLELGTPQGQVWLARGFLPVGKLAVSDPPELISLLSLDCPLFNDECGSRVPAGLTLTQGGETFSLFPNQILRKDLPDHSPRVFRGVHLSLPVEEGTCEEGALPDLALLSLPGDSCPIPVLERCSDQTLELEGALSTWPNPPRLCASGLKTFVPDDAAVTLAQWSLEDPYGNLVTLEEPRDGGAVSQHRFTAAAVGLYQVSLRVTAGGRQSCVTDELWFQVEPAANQQLRAELVWRDAQGNWAADGDRLELLLKYPYFSDDGWEDSQWICSPNNENPKTWARQDMGHSPQCTPGDMAAGLPALVTLARFDHELQLPYVLAVKARESNNRELFGEVRVYRDKVLEYAYITEPLPPGSVVELARLWSDRSE